MMKSLRGFQKKSPPVAKKSTAAWGAMNSQQRESDGRRDHARKVAHKGIILVEVDRSSTNLERDEARTNGVRRVMGELDRLRDLDERCYIVVGYGTLFGSDSLEDIPPLLAGESDITDGVQEGERGENVASGDLALVDRGADTTGVDESTVDFTSGRNSVIIHCIGDLQMVSNRPPNSSSKPGNGTYYIPKATLLRLARALVKLNAGFTDNLFTERIERLSPIFNFKIELRFLSGGVVKADRYTLILGNLPSAVPSKVDSTEVFAPSVSGHYEHFLAVQVLLDRRILPLSIGEVTNQSVGVTTDDKIKPTGL